MIRALTLVVAAALLAAVAGTWASAQVFQTTPVEPRILSGADIGFRVVGMRGSTPVGSLVIRADGQWVAVDFGGPGPRQLTAR
jgi:hypothetical protein